MTFEKLLTRFSFCHKEEDSAALDQPKIGRLNDKWKCGRHYNFTTFNIPVFLPAPSSITNR